jgi:predicted nucleic acid-binding protein
MIVVDASVLVAMCLPGPLSDNALRLRLSDPDWVAPVLARSEIANVLATYVRNELLSSHVATEMLRAILDLIADHWGHVDALDALQLAIQSRCTAYDCEYIALARALGLRLVTTDRAVLEAWPQVAQFLGDY